MMSHLDHHPHAYYYHDSRAYEREHGHLHHQAHHYPQPPHHYYHHPHAPTSLHSEEAQQDHQEQHYSQEEEVASFLLSLKHNHRSITPEPGPWQAEKTQASPLIDYSNQSPVPAVPLEELLHKSNSVLVSLQDQDLVPDALFLAMSQMIPTRMSVQDRVGCYRDREVGFLGMCCMHCGGQPGFGRYFPNSVRSLAQTTTSQTILKHIGGKCRQCPDHIKRAVAHLQRLQDQREACNGKPRYGSRKVFFQRVWDRLHQLDAYVDEDGNFMTTGPCYMPPQSSVAASSYHHSHNAAAAARHHHSQHHDAKYDDASSSQTPSDVDEDQTLEAWPSADETDKKVKPETA